MAVVDIRTKLEQNTNIATTGESYDRSCSGCRVAGVHERVPRFHGDLDRSDVRIGALPRLSFGSREEILPLSFSCRRGARVP